MDKEILKRIDLLAAKLGVTADAVWELLIKQAAIEGWSDLIIGLLLLGCAIGSALLFRKALRSEDGFWNDGSIAAITFGAAAICFIGSLVMLSSFYTPLFNPGYWALTELTKAVK